ncbi:MAG: hypothetical protein ACXWV6_10220 [Chitinophagaceae bacterium]
MEQKKINPHDVKGWGIDFNPEDEPTYPMKHYTGDDHKRLDYERPPLQELNTDEYHSNERPGMSAVFGVTVQPSGVSGMMRKKAFKYSENHYGHWLLLMAADRVNVVEGIIADIKRGHFPNIFLEKGGKAQWKYNRKEAVKNTVITVAVIAVVVWWFRRKNKLKKA